MTMIDGATDGALAEVNAVAQRVGLTAKLTQKPGPGGAILGITVERKGDDWSMDATQIAIGRSIPEVSRAAVEAIKEMAPRLQKKLDELDPAHEAVLPAYGVGADGTITALRVERDGSVRLHPDDIERIAEAVVRLAREDAGERGMEYLRTMAGAEILTVDT